MENWTPEKIKDLFTRLNGGPKRINSLIMSIMRVSMNTASQLCRRDAAGNPIKVPSRGSGVALLNLLETLCETGDAKKYLGKLIEKNSEIKKRGRKAVE